ncbi:hypothetical protein [Bacillus thuringiensis]|uniref:hypothetical protein n=1 Tax=Bacillus thuringiensis TaxID=1428 RepID=UPI001596C758|nr:hypothetical protein [Bacillus thuringiensis]
MGTLLLLIALTFEIAFAIYCIVTKQNHDKIKNWIRIFVFIAFVILTLSSVIVWSFHWITLTILLFILAVKGTFSLIRNQKNLKKYKTFKIVLKSIMMILATIFASYLPVEATYRFSIYFISAVYYDEFIKITQNRRSSYYGNFTIIDRFDF